MKPTMLFVAAVFILNSTYSQSIVCENSSCTANDYTLDHFYLGNENGDPFGPGYCEPGETVSAHIWSNFVANSAADRFSLYLHFNLYVDGIYISTTDNCYYDGVPIPTDITLDILTFDWACGADIELKDFYISWQPNAGKSCDCNTSKCSKEETIVVRAPLIANFDFNPSCLTAYTLDFTSSASGGEAPYTYVWDFGDGETSTLENPTHTYTSNGPYTVSLTVHDTQNTDYYEFAIVNFDANLPPVIYAPPDLNIEGCSSSNIPTLSYSSIEKTITESELGTAGGSLSITSSIVSLTYIDVMSGTCPTKITRTFNVTDTCLNTASNIQTIIINDTIEPTASNPEPMFLQCAGDIPTPNPNVVIDANDNCTAPTVVFVSDISDNSSCPETIIRTYKISDACGNSINVVQSIIINDDVAPTASNPDTIVLDSNDPIPSPDAAVVIDEADNCGNPEVTFISENTIANTCEMTITRIYRVTDTCNNSINVSHEIIVNTNTAPVDIALDDMTLTCETDIPAADLNIITNASAKLSDATVLFVGDVSDGLSCPETIVRTYRILDDCGNSIDVTQNIIIADNIYPTASDPQPTAYSTGQSIHPPNPLVVIDEADNCSEPTVAFVSETSDNNNCPETITRIYSVTDACGNSIDVSHIITIIDNVSPLALDPDPITVDCLDSIPDPDISIVYYVIDNNATPKVAFVSQSINNDTCGNIISRIYNVSDDCGNNIDVTHRIYVEDNIAPTIDINLEPEITITCGELPRAPEPSITDNCSTDIDVSYTEDIISISEFSYDVVRIWTAEDACSNFSSVTQTIHMLDSSETSTANITLCINDSPLDVMTLTDDPNGTWSGDLNILEGTTIDPSITPQGTYNLSYANMNDQCETINEFIITVDDHCVDYSCIKSTFDVNISKLVTPNNDLDNDTFNVTYILNAQLSNKDSCDITTMVTLYNRWGTLVYQSDNYHNDWGGISSTGSVGQAEKLPTGTYYYVVELINSGLQPIQGFIYLGTDE